MKTKVIAIGCLLAFSGMAQDTKPAAPAKTSEGRDEVEVSVQFNKDVSGNALEKHNCPIVITIKNNSDEAMTYMNIMFNRDEGLTLYSIGGQKEKIAIYPSSSGHIFDGNLPEVEIPAGKSVSTKESIPLSVLSAKYKSYVMSIRVWKQTSQKAVLVFSQPFSLPALPLN